MDMEWWIFNEGIESNNISAKFHFLIFNITIIRGCPSFAI